MRRACAIAGLLLLSLASGVRAQAAPPPTAAHPPRPQEADSERAPRYVLPELPEAPERHHSGLLITGVLTVTVSYVFTVFYDEILQAVDTDDALYGCDSVCKGDKLALIPLLGPWLALPTNHDHATFYTFFGVSQLLGLALTLGGLYVFLDSVGPHFASLRRFSFAAMPTRDGAEMALRLQL